MFSPLISFLADVYPYSFLVPASIAVVFGIVLWKKYVGNAIFFSEQDLDSHAFRARVEAETILKRANEDSLRIIAEAGKSAQEIVKRIETVATSLQGELQKAIQELAQREREKIVQASEDIIKVYRGSFEQGRVSFDKTLETISAEVSREAHDGVVKLSQFLKDEISRREQDLRQAMKEAREKIDKETELKKEESVKLIEKGIFDIIVFVSREVLGKAIDPQAYEELIIRSLDRAKKEDFF